MDERGRVDVVVRVANSNRGSTVWGPADALWCSVVCRWMGGWLAGRSSQSGSIKNCVRLCQAHTQRSALKTSQIEKAALQDRICRIKEERDCNAR